MHPKGTLFQTTEWLGRVASGVVVYALMRNSEELCGGIAFPVNSKFGVKGHFIPQLGPYGGPLVSASSADPTQVETEEKLMVAALLEGLPIEDNYQFTILDGQCPLPPFNRAGFDVSLFFTHKITGTIQEYESSISKRRRDYLRQLKKLVAEGEITLNRVTEYAEVNSLVAETSSHQGFQFREGLLDRALLKQDVDRLWMGYIARDKAGNPLGSTLLIFDDHCGYYLVGGVKRGLPGALGHANSLCMDGLIRFCLETGRVFDFEGSTIPSIALFFSQMGGKQTPFYRVSRFHSVRYNLLRAIGNIKAVRKLTK